MPIKFRFDNVDKGAWILLRQAYNLIFRCEDRVFSEYDLTTEQHTVLMAIKKIGTSTIISWKASSLRRISLHFLQKFKWKNEGSFATDKFQ